MKHNGVTEAELLHAMTKDFEWQDTEGKWHGFGDWNEDGLLEQVHIGSVYWYWAHERIRRKDQVEEATSNWVAKQELDGRWELKEQIHGGMTEDELMTMDESQLDWRNGKGDWVTWEDELHDNVVDTTLRYWHWGHDRLRRKSTTEVKDCDTTAKVVTLLKAVEYLGERVGKLDEKLSDHVSAMSEAAGKMFERIGKVEARINRLETLTK